jgi:hypothetical protein
MAGLIPTGTGYEKSALSGFVRQSAQQQQEEMAQEELKAKQSQQLAMMVGQGASIGLSIGILCALLL